MRPAAFVVPLTLALTLVAPAKVDAIKPLTCRDWQGMALERQTTYVRGVIEGVSMATAAAALALLPHAPPEQQLALAQRLASSLVTDRSVGAYVSEMTAICRDPALPPGAPLGLVFLAATDALRAREFSPDGGSGPAPGSRDIR